MPVLQLLCWSKQKHRPCSWLAFRSDPDTNRKTSETVTWTPHSVPFTVPLHFPTSSMQGPEDKDLSLSIFYFPTQMPVCRCRSLCTKRLVGKCFIHRTSGSQKWSEFHCQYVEFRRILFNRVYNVVELSSFLYLSFCLLLPR